MITVDAAPGDLEAHVPLRVTVRFEDHLGRGKLAEGKVGVPDFERRSVSASDRGHAVACCLHGQRG
jgi:hypothetical protein